MALWVGIPLTLTLSLGCLCGRPLAARFSELSAAPLAYLGAARGWHAVLFPQPAWRAVVFLAAGWALALPCWSVLPGAPLRRARAAREHVRIAGPLSCLLHGARDERRLAVATPAPQRRHRRCAVGRWPGWRAVLLACTAPGPVARGCRSPCWEGCGGCGCSAPVVRVVDAKRRMAAIATCARTGTAISGTGSASSSCRRCWSRSSHCRLRWLRSNPVVCAAVACQSRS